MRLGSRGTVVPRAGRWFGVLVCSGLAVVLSSTPSGGAPGPSEPAASALHAPAIRGSPDRPGASWNGGGPGTGPSCPDRGRVLDHGGPVETDPVVFLDFWGWHRDPLGEHRYLVDFLGAIGSSRWLGLVGHYTGAPPSVPGAAIAWVAGHTEELDNGQTVRAQKLALSHGLHPDWRPAR